MVSSFVRLTGRRGATGSPEGNHVFGPSWEGWGGGGGNIVRWRPQTALTQTIDKVTAGQ